jgi:hypothetical protein
MFALVHQGQVVQVVATEEECFPVAPELAWVEAPGDVEPGWSFDDNEFAAPAPFPQAEPTAARDGAAALDALKAALIAKGALTREEAASAADKAAGV